MVGLFKRWLALLTVSRREKLSVSLAIFSLLLGSAALSESELPNATPESMGVDSQRLMRLSILANDYVAKGKVAGVVACNRGGKIIHQCSRSSSDQ